MRLAWIRYGKRRRPVTIKHLLAWIRRRRQSVRILVAGWDLLLIVFLQEGGMLQEMLRACFATLEYSDTADIIILVFRYYKNKCFAFFWILELNASI